MSMLTWCTYISLTNFTERVIDNYCKQTQKCKKQSKQKQFDGIKPETKGVPLQIEVTPDNGMLKKLYLLVDDLEDKDKDYNRSL